MLFSFLFCHRGLYSVPGVHSLSYMDFVVVTKSGSYCQLYMCLKQLCVFEYPGFSYIAHRKKEEAGE